MRCSICSVCTNVSTWWVKRQLTRRSRGIRAASVSFGGKNGLRKLGLCGTHPLTRR
ncbi:hypothetical protein BVJ62_19545 [Vibrio cholerae]|nr:hypothetical protein [Vibrio cholerae]